MPGNTFGNFFKVTTFGESHGGGIGVVIDGVPSKIPLSIDDIQQELDRRKPGQSNITTQRQESDRVEILSGVFEGQTLGTPIALLIRNTDHHSKDYDALATVFRPGHADYGYFAKFGVRDHRGGGRSSGRETAARVAAGAIAKKVLLLQGVAITAYTLAIADIYAHEIDFSEIERNSVRSPDALQAVAMIAKIEEAARLGDSVGGIVECVITGLPPGIGEPVFDKLDAVLAHAVLSIGSIKGIEFGDGFSGTHLTGSEFNDALDVSNGKVYSKTQHAGGILGGISTGDTIIFRSAVRPTPSVSNLQSTITQDLIPTNITINGRHDPCICPRIVPVIESMAAITILDYLLIQNIRY